MSDPLPPWYIPPNMEPLTVQPPDPGTPPGWPGYNPAAPSPTPAPSPSPAPSPTPAPAATITDSLTVSTPSINFPPPSLPIMDAKGNMNSAWYQVLLALFRRSGSNDALGTTAGTDLAVSGRSTIGQIDSIRQEVVTLRAELALARSPAAEPLRDALNELRALMAALPRAASEDTSEGEIYALMRR